jgi:hypothetical protein
MPIRDYPFIAVRGGRTFAIRTPDSKPQLWVRIRNPHSNSNLSAVSLACVDTGADQCMIPAPVAVRLGHNLTAVKPISVNTASGKANTYPHTCRIEILGVLPDGRPNLTQVLHTIPDAPVHCSENLPIVLLGRKGFLDLFDLWIRYPERVFSIQRPSARS